MATDKAAVAMIERVVRHVMPADIAAAFHASEARYGPGGLTMVETTLLLLEGGLAFLDLVTSPLDLQIPANSEITAGWTRWRVSDSGEYEIEHRDRGVWSTIAGTEIDRDTRTPQTVAGTWAASSAWSAGPTAIVRRDALVLTAAGEIERRGARLATFGGQDGTLSSQVRSSYSEWSSVDAARQDESGQVLHDRYTFLQDGLTVEIHHADGRVERKLGFSLGTDFVLDDRRYTLASEQTILSQPGEAQEATEATRGVNAKWLATIAESDEESEKRGDKRVGPALHPDTLAREAVRKAHR